MVHLRPLSLGEIFDRTAELYRKNFVLFGGLSGVYAGAIMVLALLRIWVTFSLSGGSANPLQAALLGLFLIVEICVMFVLAGVSMAANSRAVAWVNLGEPATIFGAYRSILPRAGRYVWLMIVAGFRIYAPVVLFFLVFTAAIFAIPGIAGRGAAGADRGILAGLTMFVFLVVAFVFSIWMLLRYSLAVPACVVEDLKARQAIKRSIELTKGSRGRIFVLFLLTIAITFAIVAFTQFPLLIPAFKHPGQPLPVWTLALQQVLNFVTSTLIGPIYAIGLTLFYYDQRIRKESFDIEWMMKAAGLTALPATEGEMRSATADETGPAQA
jgi:uncharacterized membrane protein